MALSIGFHYTDADWTKIVRELPAVAEPQKLRRELESQINLFCGDGITDPAGHRRGSSENCGTQRTPRESCKRRWGAWRPWKSTRRRPSIPTTSGALRRGRRSVCKMVRALAVLFIGIERD